MLRRIGKEQLSVGMFIHAFEGKWTDHPFWLPRFLLKHPGDLEKVRESNVSAVIIDESRGIRLVVPRGAPIEGRAVEELALRRSPMAVEHAVSFDVERKRAGKLVSHSVREMSRLFSSAHAGEGLRLDRFAALAAEIMSSVSRNPYALIAITRLKDRDEYTYVHSLAVSALMASFARAKGLSEQDVFDMALAGLLHDIGKMVVPNRILTKPASLTDEEFAIVRTHPEQGYLLLSQHAAIPPLVLDVARHHHERLDGTGYPFRLKGEAISRAARMAAICDVYDALTSNRSYKAAWTSEQAIERMSDWNGAFDRELLFSFMRTIGVYPPGLLVQLRSNRLAITMPNGQRASRPRVRAFYDSRNHEAVPLEDLVLEESLAGDQITGEEYPLDWGFSDWPMVSEQLLNGQMPRLTAGGVADRVTWSAMSL